MFTIAGSTFSAAVSSHPETALQKNLKLRCPMSALENYRRITPFLWFDANAEEAVDFYVSVFKNSRRLDEMRNADDSSGPKGKVLTISFELDGQKFTALHGGPLFKFNESVTLGDSNGASVKLSSYKGRVVLLDFWATWCEGCKGEIP
jgi:hypothetical protein